MTATVRGTTYISAAIPHRWYAKEHFNRSTTSNRRPCLSHRELPRTWHSCMAPHSLPNDDNATDRLRRISFVARHPGQSYRSRAQLMHLTTAWILAVRSRSRSGLSRWHKAAQDISGLLLFSPQMRAEFAVAPSKQVLCDAEATALRDFRPGRYDSAVCVGLSRAGLLLVKARSHRFLVRAPSSDLGTAVLPGLVKVTCRLREKSHCHETTIDGVEVNCLSHPCYAVCRFGPKGLSSGRVVVRHPKVKLRLWGCDLRIDRAVWQNRCAVCRVLSAMNLNSLPTETEIQVDRNYRDRTEDGQRQAE